MIWVHAMLLAIFLASAQLSAAQCGNMGGAYAHLSAKIVPRTAKSARELTPAGLERGRSELERLLERDIDTVLSARPGISASELRATIQCIQGASRAEEENPALPYVILLAERPVRRFLIGFVVNAGGSGIPDSIARLAVWTREGGRWRSSFADTDLYDRSSFSLMPLKSKGLRDYLIVGKEYGDTGSRLKLELVRVTGNKLQVIWKTFDFAAGSVNVKGDTFVVHYIPDRRTDALRQVVFRVDKFGVHREGNQ